MSTRINSKKNGAETPLRIALMRFAWRAVSFQARLRPRIERLLLWPAYISHSGVPSGFCTGETKTLHGEEACIVVTSTIHTRIPFLACRQRCEVV